MKITHIGPDSQFLQFIAEVFESAAPGANEYIVVVNPGQGHVRFPIRFGRVRTVMSIKRGALKIFSGVRDSDMIIAHMMTQQAALGFVASRPGAMKVWSGWGSDYYGSDESPDTGLLGSSTLALAARLRKESDGRNSAQAFKEFLKKEAIRRLIHGAAARTDCFSAPIQDDLAVFKNRFPEFHGDYSQINYGSVEDSFAQGGRSVVGTNILVGNSATFTNNHLEIFDQLVGLDTLGRKIVVPLSYGKPEYRDAIAARGSSLFGSAFTPLIDYLPLKDYLSIVASCNVVIMNHTRQQALGNIGAAMYYGAHVFLNKASPVVEFLRSRGAVIHTTDELEANGLPGMPLLSESVATNRRVLESIWGSELVVKNVEALISRIDR